MRHILLILALLVFPVSAFAADGKAVTYDVNGMSYEGYFIDAKKGAPFVLLIHDWDGLTDYEVKRARMLSQRGYSVFAADLFGAGVRPTETDAKKKLTGELYKDRAKMRALMMGALAKARELGANTGNGVAIGYCFGGASVLELARSGAPLLAFVTFHGGLETPEGQDYSKTKGQVIVFHGTADTSVTMDHFASLANQLEAAGVMHEMTTYSGAPHAFTVFDSSRYHKVADQKSWRRFVDIINDLTMPK